MTGMIICTIGSLIGIFAVGGLAVYLYLDNKELRAKLNTAKREIDVLEVANSAQAKIIRNAYSELEKRVESN